MTFHISIIVILFLIGLPLYQSKNLFLRKIYLFITFCILFFIAGFKDSSIGNDTFSYIKIFTNISNYDLSFMELFGERYEYGFILFVKLLTILSDNYQILFIVASFVVLWAWMFVIEKHSKNAMLSIFFFMNFKLFYFLLTNIRASLAMAIILLSYHFWLESKFKVSYLLFFLASLFHVSSLVFILFFITQNIKLNKKNTMLLIITTGLGFFYFDRILFFFLQLFPRYQSYLNTAYFSGEAKISTLMIFLLLCSVYILGEFVLKEKDNRYEQSLSTIMLLAVLISFIAINSNMINRFTNYFSMFIVLYIPLIISKIKGLEKKFLISLVLMIIFFLYNIIILYYRPEWNIIIPYRTIF